MKLFCPLSNHCAEVRTPKFRVVLKTKHEAAPLGFTELRFGRFTVFALLRDILFSIMTTTTVTRLAMLRLHVKADCHHCA